MRQIDKIMCFVWLRVTPHLHIGKILGMSCSCRWLTAVARPKMNESRKGGRLGIYSHAAALCVRPRISEICGRKTPSKIRVNSCSFVVTIQIHMS